VEAVKIKDFYVVSLRKITRLGVTFRQLLREIAMKTSFLIFCSTFCVKIQRLIEFSRIQGCLEIIFLCFNDFWEKCNFSRNCLEKVCFFTNCAFGACFDVFSAFCLNFREFRAIWWRFLCFSWFFEKNAVFSRKMHKNENFQNTGVLNAFPRVLALWIDF